MERSHQIILERLLDFDHFVLDLEINPVPETTEKCKVDKPV